MRHRFALLALLAALVLAVAGCAGDPPPGSGAARPADHRRSAPPRRRSPARPTPDTSLRAPKGVVPAGERKPAPGIEVTDFDGHAITLAELRGRPVVVNFFESWCVVCRAEQDLVDRSPSDYDGQVQFLGVSNNDTVSEGRKYQRALRGPLPAGQRLQRPDLGRLPGALPAGHGGRRRARPGGQAL